MPKFLSAKEAADRLNINVRSLYAYVSRGIIRSMEGDHPHRRNYNAEDVEDILRRKGIGRKTDQISTSTLNWGYPALEASITQITRGRLLYRGKEAVEISGAATLEDTARILWNTRGDNPFSLPPAPDAIRILKKIADFQKGRGLPTSRAVTALSLAGYDSRPILGRAPAALWSEGASLMRLIAATVADMSLSSLPIHLQLGRAWKLDKKKCDFVRRALALCADHELNASTFSTRVIASTGAALSSCLIGGLEALSGPRHGSATVRLEEWLGAMWREKNIGQKIQGRIKRGEVVPGFGHPLYPDGDPRAKAILDRLPPVKRRSEIITAVAHITGMKPNLDFGLVALQQALKLPSDRGLMIFAIGRSAGWIAHAIEQNETGALIRPRAVFRPER